jgi:hypothetical protein
MEETRNAHRILVGNIKGRNHLGDIAIDWRLILQ